ncbi:MAG: transcriptional regulator, TetR family [Amycolatopsis sp.]|uniref:TetR/AcrR family transcriptional regulator n=1 Tax=Amycolatopsis sp. TaxID=37632 RepID=UPI0026099FF8|nr:TetR/AcrR family transcriptional regulator [Amycolatopsis sp.]MCU1679783.1 transcriptional regulator, TetR family [Amycolatopsis sp.]
MPRPSVREVILDTAVAELHRTGFAACSVDTITKAAGVPKGSFYNHFKSKEALGAEAVARYAEGSGWGDGEPADMRAVERLRHRFELMRDVVIEHEFTRGCLIGNMGAEQADHSAVIRAQVDVSLKGWSESIGELILTGQAEGDIAAGQEPERLGRFMLNAFEGTLMRVKVVKTTEPFEDFFGVFFDVLLCQ